jgi:xylan 1,4-beta-xylosidase
LGNFYAGDTNQFGLFDRFGTPKKTFYAFKAFAELRTTPVRLSVLPPTSNQISIGAGVDEDKTQISILVANTKASDESLQIQLNNLPWSSAVQYQASLLNHDKDLISVEEGEVSNGQIVLQNVLETPSVVLVRLNPIKRP